MRFQIENDQLQTSIYSVELQVGRMKGVDKRVARTNRKREEADFQWEIPGVLLVFDADATDTPTCASCLTSVLFVLVLNRQTQSPQWNVLLWVGGSVLHELQRPGSTLRLFDFQTTGNICKHAST